MLYQMQVFLNMLFFMVELHLGRLYNLPRYSEDLDFSLIEPDDEFDLSRYEKNILAHLNNYGLNHRNKDKRA